MTEFCVVCGSEVGFGMYRKRFGVVVCRGTRRGDSPCQILLEEFPVRYGARTGGSL